MRILDAYILRRILKPLALVFVAFVAIYVVVDLFDHIHAFVDNRVPLSVVILYYIYSAPQIIVLTAPIAMLLAALLSIGRLSKRNEIMAVKGSGISLYRAFVPILGLALAVSAVMLVTAETAIPPATRNRIAIEEAHIKKSAAAVPRLRTDVRYVGPDGTMFLVRKYDVKRLIMKEVTVEEFDQNDRLKSRLDAETAVWKDGEWIFRDGRFRRFLENEEVTLAFDEIALGYSEPTPSDLGRRRLEPEEMGFADLRKYINRLRSSGSDPRDLMVQLHLKIAFPFVILVMTLMGASFAARARKSGFALCFTFALAISFVYYGLIRVCQVFGSQGLVQPPVAAWAANVLFAALGVTILVKTPK